MARKTKTSKPTQRTLEVSEEEQWRLINQSGILKKVSTLDNSSSPEDSEDTPLAEEIFSCIVLLVPFSFLLLMMEILIHFQYGRQPAFKAIMERMVPSVPIMAIFIFYTARYKHNRKMQLFLLILSITMGTRMIYLVNRGSWLVNMRQCPPLATIWVYAIVQLDLGPAVLGLTIVGMWTWWKGMKLAF